MNTRFVQSVLRIMLALIFALSVAGISTQEARAMTYLVSNLNNSGVGSLRQAILDANGNLGADVINFSISGTITLASGMTITEDVTINGSGWDPTISGGGVTWVMNISGGAHVSLNELNISNGYYSGGEGGAVRLNTGTLTVTDCTFSGNSSGWGGAINNYYGTLNVIGTTFSSNSSPNGGAIYSTNGTVKVVTSTFSGNTSTGNGAGIHALDSTLEVTNSTFSGNGAATYGGGIYARQGTGTNTAIVTNSTFSANSASTHGGGIYNDTGSLSLRNTILANSTAGEDCYTNVALAPSTNILIENNSGCSIPLSSSDPQLAPLADNGGPTQTFGLMIGSPAIDAGNSSVCSSSPVSNLDQRGVTRPVGVQCDIGALEARNESGSLTLRSAGADDGWILESTETSTKGNLLDATATTFRLGDDAADKQYRAILSFDTAGLPDNVIITRVVLKIKKQGQSGTDPFTILGWLRADIRKNYFGTSLTLVKTDFQAAAHVSAAGSFRATPTSNWYFSNIGSAGYPYINKTGTTQFRLYFATGDNDDLAADYMSFYSGDYATAAARPTLVVEYYTP